MADLSFSHRVEAERLQSLHLFDILQVVATVWARGTNSCKLKKFRKKALSQTEKIKQKIGVLGVENFEKF